MTDEIHSEVTVLGLGMIGTPIAATLLGNGHKVTAWNRTPGKAEFLSNRGAVEMGDVQDAVRSSPLVVVCVSDARSVHAVLEAAGDTVQDKVVVNVATTTPSQARALSELAAWRGAHYLDGAILAVPDTIGSRDAVLIYSGPERCFRDHEQLLRCLGTSHFLGADPTLAALYDAGLLDAMYGMYAGYFHALALVATAGVAAPDFTDLVVPWLRETIDLLPRFALQISERHYPTDISRLDLNADAVANIRAISREQGLNFDTLDPLHAVMLRRIENGYGGDGMSSLFEAIT